MFYTPPENLNNFETYLSCMNFSDATQSLKSKIDGAQTYGRLINYKMDI